MFSLHQLKIVQVFKLRIEEKMKHFDSTSINIGSIITNSELLEFVFLFNTPTVKLLQVSTLKS